MKRKWNLKGKALYKCFICQRPFVAYRYYAKVPLCSRSCFKTYLSWLYRKRKYVKAFLERIKKYWSKKREKQKQVCKTQV
jgi:hypothetical protein